MPAHVPLSVAELVASYSHRSTEENARATRAVVRPELPMWLSGSRVWTVTQLQFGQGGENGEPPTLVQAVLAGDAVRLDELLRGLKVFIAQQLPNELDMPAPGQLGAEAVLRPPAWAPAGELTLQQVDQKRTAAFASIINGRWMAFRLSSAAAQLSQGSAVELHADTTLLLLAAKLALPDVVAALLRHGADPRLVDGKGCSPLTAVITSPEAQGSLIRMEHTVELLLKHNAPVTYNGFNRQQINGQTRTAPGNVQAQLEEHIVYFDSAGLAAAPLVACAQMCDDMVHLPCSILKAVLAAVPSQMDADEWLAAVQVAIFASQDDIVLRAVSEASTILLAVDHRTSWSAADILLKLAMKRGTVAAVEALALLADTGNSSMLIAAAELCRRDLLELLISRGFQPCTSDVLKLMDVGVDKLATYLEAAGRAPAVELCRDCMVQNMAHWLNTLAGGAGFSCPMLQLMVKRSWLEVCEADSVSGQPLKTVFFTCHQNLLSSCLCSGGALLAVCMMISV